MTRFWLTLDEGVRFVVRCVEQMHGGEVFVPKIPSMRVADLARAIAPGCKFEIVGIRPGEKLHEVLVSPDEATHALEFDDMYIVQPAHPWWKEDSWTDGRPLKYGDSYTSDNNTRWLTQSELLQLAHEV